MAVVFGSRAHAVGVVIAAQMRQSQRTIGTKRRDRVFLGPDRRHRDMPLPPATLRFVSLSPETAGLTSKVIAESAAAGIDGIIWRSGLSLFAPQDRQLPAVVPSAPGLILDIELDRVPAGHDLVAAEPSLFTMRWSSDTEAPIDPRTPLASADEARARLGDPAAAAKVVPYLIGCLRLLVDAGVTGFCFRALDRIAPEILTTVTVGLRAVDPSLVLIGGDLPLTDTMLAAFDRTGLDYLVVPAGTHHGDDLLALQRMVRRVAPLIVEMPYGTATDVAQATILADGVIVPAAQFDVIGATMPLAAALSRFGGERRWLTSPSAPVSAVLRADTVDVRTASAAALVMINRSNQSQPAPAPANILPGAGADFRPFTTPGRRTAAFAALAPGEIRVLTALRAKPVAVAVRAGGRSARNAATLPRLVIEGIVPRVDGGDFAVRRIVGETVIVEATIYADGHEPLGAELLWRAADARDWSVVRMAELPNDRWRAEFALDRLGRHEFAVESWLDRFGGFRRDFLKKLDAGVAQPVDHGEGRALVDAADRRTGGLADVRKQLAAIADDLAASAKLLLSPALATAMAAADDRPHRLRSAIQRVDAERLAARFSSWYELFPRSQAAEPGRHGNFDDVIARLPAICAMGFDTLYFPPIHPIGRVNRKGPNNTLTPAPDDPGSPYAIGNETGGHDAIHPELGGFDDFARLVAAARDHGLEIALDFAIQCAPDHPWLTEHPGWFAWRPDGSMKYAENPPKKYQDIVNVDYYGPQAVPDLWLALRDVVLLWIGHGIATFRVDNPHTKTLPFWEWMIGEVRAAHPEVIFLAEAFTRPNMMYRLAKVGFSQSYTYFTWRNTKAELTDYIEELTTSPVKEFYRPHFFVNTPDIDPFFLQTAGRPGFRIRAVLAATLSGLFGVYSGFELCEAAPLPGREEYLDSEKYEVRQRDWKAPGNIIADIALLNRLRRDYAALQTHLNTRFYVADNDAVIYYGKLAPDGSEMILVAVSLDPFGAQATSIEVPLWEFGLGDDATIAVEDLASGARFDWRGKIQHLHLDPLEPYRIWRLAPGDL